MEQQFPAVSHHHFGTLADSSADDRTSPMYNSSSCCYHYSDTLGDNFADVQGTTTFQLLLT